jgi:hypothetical protein
MRSHRSGGLNFALTDISGRDGVFSICQCLPFLQSFKQSERLAHGNGRGVILINHGIEVTIGEQTHSSDRMEYRKSDRIRLPLGELKTLDLSAIHVHDLIGSYDSYHN